VSQYRHQSLSNERGRRQGRGLTEIGHLTFNELPRIRIDSESINAGMYESVDGLEPGVSKPAQTVANYSQKTPVVDC
jgi:hypothetical protein